jgi:hypothetical protein
VASEAADCPSPLSLSFSNVISCGLPMKVASECAKPFGDDAPAWRLRGRPLFLIDGGAEPADRAIRDGARGSTRGSNRGSSTSLDALRSDFLDFTEVLRLRFVWRASSDALTLPAW